MKDRFGRSDYRFLAVCLALLTATLWFTSRNFYRAFPEASIDFRVNRGEGESIALAFLARQGYDTGAYRKASSFTYDDDAKTFLEREAGLERANGLMSSRVRVWRWSYRWFRPLQKEEFRADVTPAGQVAEFRHEIAEDEARPAIAADAARALAERFLRDRMGRNAVAMEFVEAAEVARPNRVDRSFTWKERDFNLKDATYRVEVVLLGNEVGGYREYLKIPEQWTRDYQRMRSKNEAASTVDVLFAAGLLVGLIVVIVMRVRGHDIRWRRAATVGVVGMALGFLSRLNQMPLEEFGYPTTDSYSSFVARQLFGSLVSALGTGGFLFVLTAGAEPLYREMFPEKISLANLFQPRGLRTKRFLLGATLGVTLTGIFIAYQTAFYMTAVRLGAWSPADVPYSDMLNTRFPWLFVLFGGFFPAVFEEFLFRMFAVPFLRKVTRSLAVAVVLAGFIWGFGHSNYPQQPFYIRGVEVGIGGVALGLVMLRWGILPTLVWHYSVDAMYTAMLLLRSHSLYYRLSGAASAGVIVMPLAAAWIAYWRNGGFAPEEGLLNADETAPEGAKTEPPVPQSPAPAAKWQPLGTKTRAAALALLVIGLATLMIPVDRFDEPRYRVPEAQVAAGADAFLRSQGLDPSAFERVTAPFAENDDRDRLGRKYILQRMPLAAASSLIRQYRPDRIWLTRYFKPLSQEEALVATDPESGKLRGYSITVPEDAPGADLPEISARGIASSSLAGLGWDTAAMDLKENRSDRKKARRDYTFVWEARPGDRRNVDQARYRVEAAVAGDRPSSARAYWKLPEDFERGREQQNFLSIAIVVVKVGVIASAIVAALWLLVGKIRSGEAPWGRVLKIAIPAAVLTIIPPLLSFRSILMNYPNTIPMSVFRATSLLGLLLAAGFQFVILACAAALALSFYPDILASLSRDGRRARALDAAVALIAAIGLALAAHQTESALIARFHTSSFLDASAPGLIVSAAPALAAAAGVPREVVFYAGGLALLALIAGRLRWRLLLPAVCALAFLSFEIRQPGEFMLQYAVGLLFAAAAALFCYVFAKGNYLAYAVTFWALALRGPLLGLYGNLPPAHFAAALAILLAGLAWALLPIGRTRDA